MALEEGQRRGAVRQAELVERHLGVLVDQVAHLGGRAVLDDLRGRHHPLAQRAHQRVVVVVDERARQRLHRLAAQEVRLVDHVLLLEAPDGDPHGVVVDPGLVVRGPGAGAEEPLAGEALFDRGHGRLLRGALLDQLHLGGVGRLLRRQLVQRRGVRLLARLFQLLADAREVALVLLEIGRRDVGDRLDGVERVGALLILAGVLIVVEEPRAQHRQRGEDPVELEVILRPRRQRLAVLVELIVGQADEDPPVAVGERLPVGPGLLGEDVRRPRRRRDRPACSRPPRPPRRRSSALPLLRGLPRLRRLPRLPSCPLAPAAPGAAPITTSARSTGRRSGRGFNASASETEPRARCGLAVLAPGLAPAAGRRSPGVARRRTFAVQTGRFAAAQHRDQARDREPATCDVPSSGPHHTNDPAAVSIYS